MNNFNDNNGKLLVSSNSTIGQNIQEETIQLRKNQIDLFNELFPLKVAVIHELIENESDYTRLKFEISGLKELCSEIIENLDVIDIEQEKDDEREKIIQEALKRFQEFNK
jgi:hypothetical protein